MTSLLRAVATDFDGTLTTTGRVSADVVHALLEARRNGVRIVIVTGREFGDLEQSEPAVLSLADAVVAENGAVLVTPELHRRLALPVPAVLEEDLAARGIVVRRGEVLLAGSASDAVATADRIAALGLDVQLVRNKGALMLLPPGVSKGTGLRAALSELGVSYHATVGVGDAENDHALFDQCEVAVAVANAVPAVRDHADFVLDRAAGDGVADLLRGPLLDGGRRRPAARWQVRLGWDDGGAPVVVPGSGVNVLVTGPAGSGKSHLTGLLAEELLALEYAVGVLDVEGDHTALASLPGVVSLEDPSQLADPALLCTVLEHRFGSVVLDLSRVPAGERRELARGAGTVLAEHRAQWGSPQWVVVEEAQDLLAVWDRHAFPLESGGLCLTTYHPDELADEVVAELDLIIARAPMRRQPGAGAVAELERIERFLARCGAVPVEQVRRVLSELPATHAVLVRPDHPGELRPFRVARRRTPHVRHRHKYLALPLLEHARFRFRWPSGDLTGAVAADLLTFTTELLRADDATVAHHCGNRDLSRWISGVYHDLPLADRVAAVEVAVDRGELAPAGARRRLASLIGAHFDAEHVG